MTPLETFGQNIWIVNAGTVRMFGVLPFTTRMTVIRLRGGALWLHSPIRPTDALLAAVSTLGPVHYLVAPNKIHSLGIQPWQASVPSAATWVSPEFNKRHPGIDADGVLTNGADVPWGDEIVHIAVAGHAYLDEVVFLHVPSRTLIITDLIQKHDAASESWFWRVVKRGAGISGPEGGVPRDLRYSFRDASAARESVRTILEWDFDDLILSHGFCVKGGARKEVARCFRWLFR